MDLKPISYATFKRLSRNEGRFLFALRKTRGLQKTKKMSPEPNRVVRYGFANRFWTPLRTSFFCYKKELYTIDCFVT